MANDPTLIFLDANVLAKSPGYFLCSGEDNVTAAEAKFRDADKAGYYSMPPS